MPNDDTVGKGGWGGENVSKSDGAILECSLNPSSCSSPLYSLQLVLLHYLHFYTTINGPEPQYWKYRQWIRSAIWYKVDRYIYCVDIYISPVPSVGIRVRINKLNTHFTLGALQVAVAVLAVLTVVTSEIFPVCHFCQPRPGQIRTQCSHSHLSLSWALSCSLSWLPGRWTSPWQWRHLQRIIS